MKRTFTKLMAALALLLFIAPLGLWGQNPVNNNGEMTRGEVSLVALTFPDDNNESNHQGNYTSTWTAIIDDYEWSISKFNNNNWNNWNYIKCGNKSAASVGTIINSEAYSEAITKVEVTIDAITTSNVNSIKLYTSSDNSNWTEAGTFDKSTGKKAVTLATPTANLYYKIAFDCKKGSSGNGYVTVSKVEYFYNQNSGSTVATPTFSLASDISGTYLVDDDYVMIDCATEDADIYYTMGDDPADPTSESTLYNPNDGIEITETVTIKAIAVKEGMTNSDVASITYTFLTPLTTMPEILEAATAAGNTPADVAVTFNDWTVVGTTTNNAYITDGQYGVVVYQSNHGFASDKKLNGTAICKVQLYNSGAELLNLTASQFTVTDAGTINPYAISLEDINLKGDYFGSYVNLGQLTYDATNNVFTDGTRNIQPYNSFGLTPAPSFEDGKTYTVKGVYIIYYKSNTNTLINEIAPRVATDIVEYVGPTIAADPTSLSFNYVAGNSDENKTLTITGTELTAGITATITEGSSYFAISEDETTWQTTLSLPAAGDVIVVRFNSGLTKGTYNGTITLSSTGSGADDVTVSLTGTVTGATYTIEQYSEPATAHGTISFTPTSPVEDGTEVTLTATPAAGYEFTANSWVFYNASTLEQVTLTVTDGNKINMPDYNLAVDATFTALTTYDITAVASPTAGGNVVTDDEAWAGKEVTVLVSANNGYAFTGIVVSKTDEASTTTEISGNINDGFTFTMPAYEVTVTATFEMNLNVTYDFTSLNNFYTDANLTNHPSSGGDNNYDDLYYTNGDHFTASGTNRYFYVSGSNCCFLFGKSGALVDLPTFTDYRITEIKLHSSSGGSTKVTVAIVDDDDNTVAAAQTWSSQNTDYTYTIPAAYQQSALSVKVTNGNNAQFTSITLTREIVTTDPSIDVENEITIAHDATYGEFPYTIINPAPGVILQATSATDWITNVAVTNDKVTFTTTANPSTEEDRTGTITLSYTGAQNKTVSINQGKKVIDYAELPFTFTDGWNDIDNTVGLTDDGLGSDYGTSAKLKFDDSGDWVILKLNEAPTSLSYDIKGNSLSGNYQFDVLVSANGVNYETLASYTTGNINNSKVITITHINLASEVRYIKWIYTTKASGNVGMGNIRATANYDIYGDVTVSSLTIPSTKTCTIYTGAMLNVTTSLTNDIAANLVIADGAQLKTATQVKGTMQKSITNYEGYTGEGNGGYYLLASPTDGQISSFTNFRASNIANIDWYEFNQAGDTYGNEWINKKVAIGATYMIPGQAEMHRGEGYLYARKEDVTLGFVSSVIINPNTNTSTECYLEPTNEPYTVPANELKYISGKTWAGWNLVGNPFTCDAYLNRTYFRMNEAGDAIVEGSGAIKPCEGVFVVVTAENKVVTFSNTPAKTTQSLSLNLNGNNGLMDRVSLHFDGSNNIKKFVLNENATKLYIPQGKKDYAVVRSANEGEMPVSFKAETRGTYTLSVNAENVEMTYLHLIDNKTGADVDLLATPSYTFEASNDDYESRFRLVFKANADVEENAATETFAYFNGSEWIISNIGEATLQVVDMMGRVLSSETLSGNANVILNQAAGIYMLRLVNGENVMVQKVVVR